jgi:hypothetical protein
MTIREQVLKIASHPIKGKILSAQIIAANKTGAAAIINGEKTIKLQRINQSIK